LTEILTYIYNRCPRRLTPLRFPQTIDELARWHRQQEQLRLQKASRGEEGPPVPPVVVPKKRGKVGYQGTGEGKVQVRACATGSWRSWLFSCQRAVKRKVACGLCLCLRMGGGACTRRRGTRGCRMITAQAAPEACAVLCVGC
jgi:hypothetical protein